jgi:hypothetical protein
VKIEIYALTMFNSMRELSVNSRTWIDALFKAGGPNSYTRATGQLAAFLVKKRCDGRGRHNS